VSAPSVTPTPQRAVSIGFTEKSFGVVAAEAKKRGISPERLMLTATLDYLGRTGITQGAKAAPLVLHVPWHIRKKIIEAAKAEDATPNRFMIAAALKACEQSACPPIVESNLSEQAENAA
jgi:hypothetical protein